MSYPKINKNRNYLQGKRRLNDHFTYCIHRARVTDVYVDRGTINVEFESIPYATEVNIPLLGLSMPPKRSSDDLNELSSSWGRYIPQPGDIVLVGFGPNATPYSLGFHAIYYEGFTIKDLDRESTGGIGWGSASAKEVRSGDWDFKSSRGSFLYLGDKLRIGSGPHNTTYNKSTGDIINKSSLIINNYGPSSENRKGGARRRVLPTDPSETSIYNLNLQVAQESTDIVRSGFPKVEMTRTSMGDVIDETTFQVMASSLGGTVVRRLESVKDKTGITDLYSKVVDDLGNYGVSAPTAIMFQWTTPLSTWSISNKSTSIISSVSYDITSPLINLKASTSAVIDSINVQLGGSSAVDFLVKGTTFINVMNAFLIAVTSATSVVGSSAQNATALAAIGVAATALNNALAGTLSKKVKTE